jgi:hypothetical protein
MRKFYSTSTILKRSVTGLALILGLTAMTQCNDPQIGPAGIRVNALSASTSNLGVEYFNGTYIHCVGHADNSGWSMNLPFYFGSLPYPVISVFKGDATCQLRVKEVVLENPSTAALTTFVATSDPSGLAITGNYGNPISFTSMMNQLFYADIRMTPADFSSNFLIEFVYSDDPRNLSTFHVPTAYSLVGFSMVTESRLRAPDYGMAGGINSTLAITVAADNTIQSAAGTVTIPSAVYPADTYTIVDHILGGGDPMNYADVQATVQPQITLAHTFSIPAGALTIPASIFNLLGADATNGVDRFVIIIRVDTSGSVHLHSYEVIQFHFDAPPAL